MTDMDHENERHGPIDSPPNWRAAASLWVVLAAYALLVWVALDGMGVL